ncbi:44213_t:CDS:2, partial [Gigaspora margarita]
MPSQSKNLDDINIPNLLSSTLSGEDFLVRDSTVPTIFHQLYTIHAPIGIGNNLRVLLLVYVLMTKKPEELYRALFQDLIEFAKENSISLRPTTILTDFELVAINISRIEFPNVKNKGCLFHLEQSGWRKIQN